MSGYCGRIPGVGRGGRNGGHKEQRRGAGPRISPLRQQLGHGVHRQSSSGRNNGRSDRPVAILPHKPRQRSDPDSGQSRGHHFPDAAVVGLDDSLRIDR